MRDDRIGAVIEAMAPDWMRVAEAAHREDRPGRHECQRAAGSEIDVEPREPPRSRFPRRGEGRAIEMAFDAAIADDHRAAVPRAALPVVVAVDVVPAAPELQPRRPPDDLTDIAIQRG